MPYHTKQLGDIGQLAVALEMKKRKHSVFTEMGDLSKTDLVVLVNDRLPIRIQVKTATVNKNGSIVLSRKKDGPNYRFKYETEMVDLFALHCLDTGETAFVTSQELCNHSAGMTFRIKPSKNGQLKGCRFLEDYSFERALRDYTQSTQTDKAVGEEIVQTSKPDSSGGSGN